MADPFVEVVAPVLTAESVGRVAADEHVGAPAAIEVVHATIADQDVATVAPEQVVVLAAARQVVGGAPAEGGVHRARPGIGVEAGPADVQPVVAEAQLAGRFVVGALMLPIVRHLPGPCAVRGSLRATRRRVVLTGHTPAGYTSLELRHLPHCFPLFLHLGPFDATGCAGSATEPSRLGPGRLRRIGYRGRVCCAGPGRFRCGSCRVLRVRDGGRTCRRRSAGDVRRPRSARGAARPRDPAYGRRRAVTGRAMASTPFRPLPKRAMLARWSRSSL